MEINSTSKKRKICREEDEEEEAKMETFFALVRSMRETRDRWINFRSSGDSSKKKIIKNMTGSGEKEENRSVGAAWKPMFQLEDFSEEEANKCRNPDPSLSLLASGASDQSNSCATAKQDDAEKKGIDLRLSL